MYRLYGMNNSLGVDVEGLKGSVYDIKNFHPQMEVLEEEVREEDDNKKLKNLNSVLATNQKLFERADQIIKEGDKPVLFAGDHSIAMGSVSATSNNYDDLFLVWIDAHADINTDQTSPSGNIHGMPVSALLGMGEESLAKIGYQGPKIKAENIVYLGLRSVDPGEVDLIKKLGIKAYYYSEIKERGLNTVLDELLDLAKDKANIHISFDFDSMDPDIFPAVSTPVEGGFTKSQVIEIFERIKNSNKIRAIDLVEYNKANDKEGKSLDFALDLLDKYII